MIWVQIARLLLAVADGLIQRARDQGLIDAGRNEQLVNDLKATNDRIAKALRARAAVDPGGVQDDPNNRD